jgi:DNA-binding transcriptional regulator YiaG
LRKTKAAIRETARGGFEASQIGQQTMRRFPFQPNRESRQRVGAANPSGPALKLLSLVDKHGIEAVA